MMNSCHVLKDENKLMASDKFLSYFSFLERSPMTIPCRPSMPDVKVVLTKAKDKYSSNTTQVN